MAAVWCGGVKTMGKITEFLFGKSFDYEEMYHNQLTENSELKEELHQMRENSWEKEVEHQKKINSILSGDLANPIIERLRNDYIFVCNNRADLQYKLQRYENTDLDRENKKLTSEIKCLKFKIEELEREKAELIKLLDRYDVFFKSLGKE
jgi:hypothetical protein